jgi:hypothetical protein
MDGKGTKKARFCDDETTANASMVTSSEEAEGHIYDLCRTISQRCEAGNRIGVLSCARYDYVIFDEAGRDGELVPLRQILPHFRNGESISTKQK